MSILPPTLEAGTTVASRDKSLTSHRVSYRWGGGGGSSEGLRSTAQIEAGNLKSGRF